MIDISRAQSIPGWMSDAELTWLAQQAQERGNVLEVGSFLGRSTRALGDHTQARVFAVDPWDFSGEGLSRLGVQEADPAAYLLAKQHRDAGQRFCQYLMDLILFGKVVPIIGTLEHVRAYVPFDFTFIDANHTYPYVSYDIERAKHLMMGRGLLAGHDYGDPHWPDVKTAVDEWVGPVHVVPGTSIWWKEL